MTQKLWMTGALMLSAAAAVAAPIDLSGVFNRDTIANSTAPAETVSGTGFPANFSTAEWFNLLSNNYPDPGGDGVGDNLPTNGQLSAGAINYELGPYEADNTLLVIAGGTSTATIDVPDALYNDISVLHTGVFFAPITDDLQIQFNYTTGVPDTLVWDVADNNLPGLLGSGGSVAISMLDILRNTSTPSSEYLDGNRNLYTQTFFLDPTRLLDSIAIDVGSLPFADSQIAIYAVDGTFAVPEPSSLLMILGSAGVLACLRRRRGFYWKARKLPLYGS